MLAYRKKTVLKSLVFDQNKKGFKVKFFLEQNGDQNKRLDQGRSTFSNKNNFGLLKLFTGHVKKTPLLYSTIENFILKNNMKN